MSAPSPDDGSTAEEVGLAAITCAPETIWPLEPDARAAAVIELLNQCADLFAAAIENDDPKVAQESAHAALLSIAGLFPDQNHNAHLLLGSLNSLLIQVRMGQPRKHILSRPGAFTAGLKKGPGHAFVAGFAIAASKLLSAGEDDGSDSKIYAEVAKMLAVQGYSLKTDDHSQPKRITSSAVRKWVEGEREYPLQHRMARRQMQIHTQNIMNRKIETKTDLIAYFTEQARLAVKEAAALQTGTE